MFGSGTGLPCSILSVGVIAVTDCEQYTGFRTPTPTSTEELDSSLGAALKGKLTMVKHLPPTVKQLLTLRNPQPRAAPQLSRLNAVLTTTYQDAKTKKAEKGWLTLAVRTDHATPSLSRLTLTVQRRRTSWYSRP